MWLCSSSDEYFSRSSWATSCTVSDLHCLAKWFNFLHFVRSFPKAGHFLGLWLYQHRVHFLCGLCLCSLLCRPLNLLGAWYLFIVFISFSSVFIIVDPLAIGSSALQIDFAVVRDKFAFLSSLSLTVCFLIPTTSLSLNIQASSSLYWQRLLYCLSDVKYWSRVCVFLLVASVKCVKFCFGVQ